jgi:hypothetical protein
MSLLEMVFGCSHKRCSFPITVRGKLRRSPAASITGTYVVCLDCGKEFAYDWQQMKMIRSESDGLDVVPAIPDREAA